MIHFKIYFSYNWDICSSTSTLTAGCETCVAYSMSTFIQDRKISLPPDLSLSHKTFCQGGKQWEREADHAVVLGGDIKSNWNYIPFPSHFSRASCL